MLPGLSHIPLKMRGGEVMTLVGGKSQCELPDDPFLRPIRLPAPDVSIISSFLSFEILYKRMGIPVAVFTRHAHL